MEPVTPTGNDAAQIAEWQVNVRQHLHRHPELSGNEIRTADWIGQLLRRMQPSRVIQELGGHGIACVFQGSSPGPTVMLRCELDALPIEQTSESSAGSMESGVGHQCGHDGHMACLVGVAAQLQRQPPRRGRVVLLFQPAEETGAGARAVLEDVRFEDLQPDLVFALHNLPGYPLGQIVVRSGTICCGSRGLSLKLTGSTAHASQPETGRSPGPTLVRIFEALPEWPKSIAVSEEIAQATIVGARLGSRLFGVAPGDAELWATLRTESDSTMQRLVERAETEIGTWANAAGLAWEIDYHDIFPAAVNSPAGVERVVHAVDSQRLTVTHQPFRWSEDFAHFLQRSEGAFFGIGAGVDSPALHDPAYEFPDALIEPCVDVMMRLVRNELGD